MDENLLNTGNIVHPGVGPFGINSQEPIKRHAYYQWVPFVLFGQAIMFYLTHRLWKHLEGKFYHTIANLCYYSFLTGGRLRYLVDGLKLAAFALEDKTYNIAGKRIPTKEEK